MNHHKILFAGDPHGDFKPVIEAVRECKPEAVILLGDYDLEMPLEAYLQEIVGLTQIWWIAGNHEFESPERYNHLFQSALADKSLHLKVTEIAGLKVAGLGGIFLGRVWYPPQRPRWRSKRHFLQGQPVNARHTAMTLKHQGAIWHDEFEAMKKLKADILVTHEAPGSHRHGFDAIGELAAAMGVKKIFHGHLHENYTGTVKKHISVAGVADRTVADLFGNILKQA